MDANDANAAEKLKAELRLQELVAQNPRIIVHSGALKIGQRRGAVFDNDTGCVVIGSTNTIHSLVVHGAGLPVTLGRFLSGFVDVTEAGLLEWSTSGALSTFPPEHLPLPLAQILDKIRGTGIRAPTP